ncbi:MAG: peptide ABC transporter substrate-binding protein, partial [Zoogloeaceae bacterium]|nr:peptide ABC transporter substrate-binding protein [Zoogloeaceae bacterium]
MLRLVCFRVALLLWVGLVGCRPVWNDPYPASEGEANVLYSAFTNRPKHLDPVQSYSEDEATFLYQIYEPPLQYHYLKRPYSLIPAAAAAMPKVTLLDAAGRELPANADPSKVAESQYEIRIQPGILYQPHPAFAQREEGAPRYFPMPSEDLARARQLGDFAETGSRELIAADYVNQIKRLAHPRLHSPILELMGDYIIGLKGLHARLQKDPAAQTWPATHIDLTNYPLEGVQVVDRYTYRVRLKGAYPQFLYWLAMPFFAPVPPEVEQFFDQPGMAERNL